MKVRRKPIILEAQKYIRWVGSEDGFECTILNSKDWITECRYEKCRFDFRECEWCKPYIQTPEGRLYINDGYYIITGVKGERYPIKPEIFHETYEILEE